jgi:hypothetical protein
MHVNASRQPVHLVAEREIGFARERSMLDFVMLAMGLVFFALAIGYSYACDRL